MNFANEQRIKITNYLKENNITKKDFIEVNKLQYKNVIEALARKYVKKANSKRKSEFYTDLSWCWNGKLIYEGKNISFQNCIPPEVLNKIIPNEEKIWFLVEKDGRSNFWVYEGEKKIIIDIAFEFDFNEYLIASKKLEWLIVKSHHETLNIIGDKVENRI